MRGNFRLSGGLPKVVLVALFGLGALPPVTPSRPFSPPPITPRKIDEYGPISFKDEMVRLENAVIALRGEPTGVLYIYAYGGRRGCAGEARLRAERAKNYVVNRRGADPLRVSTRDGGYREELTVELWVIPRWADPPSLTPSVDPSEVTFTGSCRPEARPRRRRPRA